MRILFIGFLVLAGWMAFSTYIYVCKIKGFCQEPVPNEMVTPPAAEEASPDTLAEPVAEKKTVKPADVVVHFAFDRSDFSPDAQLEEYILESKEYLDQNAQARLKFTGHTCSIGTDAYNQALGMRRAQSVKRYFESKGVPVQNSIVESKGEKEPIADNRTAAGRAQNRRTVITITE